MSSHDLSLRLEHDGATYVAKIVTIESTHLGYEDHGIFTANLSFKGDGWGQGTGHFCLDGKPDPKWGRRIGTAFGHDHIIAVLGALRVGTWEQLKGLRCLALYTEEYGSIVGISDLDATAPLIFKDHADAWRQDGAA